MPFARRSVAFEIEEAEQAWFYSMYLLCLTGLLGITITGDAFNAFVFLEISSLSTYVLIALGPRPARAARGLPVSDHGHDRRDLLRDRHRPALSRHRQPQHRRHRRAPRTGSGPVTRAPIVAGAGLPHRRHQPEARAVSAARLAAQRLRLRALLRDRVPGRHRDQGRDLPAGALLLLGLRRRHRLPRPAGLRDRSSRCRSRPCSSPRCSRSSSRT